MDETQSTIIPDDEPTEGQLQVAFERACHEFGDCVADYESEEFETEFTEQLNRLLTEEAAQSLVEKGYMTAHVLDNGELGYTLTPYGKAIAEELEKR
jgi:hypothetical protein